MTRRQIDYQRLIGALQFHEIQQNREAANEFLRQLAEYHRKRIAKNDRFMLRCRAEINMSMEEGEA